jgi:DNA replication and repair protein RecF
VHIEELFISGFRNLQPSLIQPDAQLNVLIGDNGQGKTSFLEAIFFLSWLRSFRNSKQLLAWDQAEGEVRGVIRKEIETQSLWKTQLKIQLQENLGSIQKRAWINEKPVPSRSQYVKERLGTYPCGFHSVLFHIGEDWVRRGPSLRREYWDRVLASEDPEYLEILSKYQKTLDQRNRILKEFQGQQSLLERFTEPLVKYGARLTYARLQWLEKANPLLQSYLLKLLPSFASFQMVYGSSWMDPCEGLCVDLKAQKMHFTLQADKPSLEFLERSLLMKSFAMQSLEKKIGYTLVGPHRDDYLFFLEHRLLEHRSEGEIKSAMLAIKLTEMELYEKQTHHKAIFLVDDFSSELDKKRREFLMKFLSQAKLQVFVTTTEPWGEGTCFLVKNGTIKEGKA